VRIIHTESSTVLGGQERRVLAESSGMRDRGHDVWLVTPGHGAVARRAFELGLPVVEESFRAWRLPMTALRLRTRLARLRPDVVNSHSSRDSWACCLAFAPGRRSESLIRSRHISAPVRPGPLHRFLYGQPDLVVTTGEHVRRGLAASGLVPLHGSVSIPTGIEVDRFVRPSGERDAVRAALGIPREVPVVGVVAYLRPDKGHAVLLEALPAIRRRVPQALLVVVGDGRERVALHTRAADGLPAGAVRFLGAREDVPALLSAMDVFCLPSIRNEGVPQSLLQASAAGLAVVSTTVGGIPEAVRDGLTGLLVPPGDPAALARAVADLLVDAERRARMGTAGRDYVRSEFSLAAMLDRTEQAYALALRRASARASGRGGAR